MSAALLDRHQRFLRFWDDRFRLAERDEWAHERRAIAPALGVFLSRRMRRGCEVQARRSLFGRFRETGQTAFGSEGFESRGSTGSGGSTGSRGGRLPTRASRPGIKRTARARSHLNNQRNSPIQRSTWNTCPSTPQTGSPDCDSLVSLDSRLPDAPLVALRARLVSRTLHCFSAACLAASTRADWSSISSSVRR